MTAGVRPPLAPAGLRLSAAITLTMLSLVVILPIGALLLRGAGFGPAQVWADATPTVPSPRCRCRSGSR